MSAKTKIFFTTALANWDADFYVKVDDDVHVNLGMQCCCNAHIFNYYKDMNIVTTDEFLTCLACIGMLATTLARHRSKPRVYIGCMKSGPVLAQK